MVIEPSGKKKRRLEAAGGSRVRKLRLAGQLP
jgi:hypothetical protein